MKKSITILLLFLLNGIAFSQNWIVLNSKTSRRLSDVYFFNRDTGIVCGEKGIMLRTENGGFNWTPVPSGTSDQLAYLHFIDQNTGYATGFVGNGTLIKTTDGGKTWTNASLNIPESRSGGIFFSTPDTGYYAFGNKYYQNSKILKTTNGGSSWDTVFRTPEWISFLFFTDSDHGWATASGSNVYYTFDGGNSWDTFRFTCDMWMSGIYFLNKDTGFVGGLDMGSGCFAIMKTTDGGKNWISVSDSGASRILFINHQIAYAIAPDTSGNGQLIKSVNGGNSWTLVPTPKNYLSSVFFLDEYTGYCVGDSGAIIRYSKTFTINGHVTTSASADITKGEVKLIAFSNGIRSAEVASTTLDSVGNFTFSDIQSGRYILLVTADTLSYPDLAPTYFGNVLFWNEAQIINLSDADTVNLTVMMIENNTIPPGTASISGVVSSIDGTRAGTNPIKDVDVTLKKVPGGQIKKTKTDDNGLYRFDNLPVGNYNIFIDIPGLPMDSLIPVKIESEDTAIGNVNFGVDSTGIHVDLSLSQKDEVLKQNVTLFPVPASGFVYVGFQEQGNYQLEIQDINGRVLQSFTAGNSIQIKLDIQSLPSGVYLVKVSDDRHITVLKLLIRN
ncbi:MAG TPA: YCF48-related protein [Bacteroidia bacterium]|nr:YCF48-related protein [Bacteroidia bacterium]HRS59936.1 YCF48-related protein [Bacteroidia bacterium]HRU68703.1 YCF48-related protein [Bacteroidia bacterium]